MANPPDDEVDVKKVEGIVRPQMGHHLLQFLEPGEGIPATQAIVALPFSDIAHQMDMILPAGDSKDKVMRHLLDARNIAARLVFEANHI